MDIMEISVREWLVITGVIIVVTILVESLRRAWQARRQANELSFGLGDWKGDDDDPYGSELPNGGARVICDESDPVDDTGWTAEAMPRETAREKTGEVPRKESRETPLEAPPQAPRDMAVERGAGEDALAAAQPLAEEASRLAGWQPEPSVGHGSRLNGQLLDTGPGALQPEAVVPAEGPDGGIVPDTGSEDAAHLSPGRMKAARRKPAPAKPRSRDKKKQERVTRHRDPEPVQGDVLVINVVASPQRPFQGAELLDFFQRHELRFGHRAIFHRLADPVAQQAESEPAPEAASLFSVANGMEPGTFDLASLGGMTIPALSFFMAVPGPAQPHQAFLAMVETVHHLSRETGASLQDDQHSVLTLQTLDLYKDRIRECERRSLAASSKRKTRA